MNSAQHLRQLILQYLLINVINCKEHIDAVNQLTSTQDGSSKLILTNIVSQTSMKEYRYTTIKDNKPTQRNYEITKGGKLYFYVYYLSTKDY